MPSLSYADLDSICVAVKAGNPHYIPESAAWCTDLYFTGCRPNEITDRTLWSYDGMTTYTLNPLKGNNPRYFDAAILTGGLKRFIAGDANYYSTVTYSRMRSIFRTTTPYGQIYNDTKQMDLYLFRYRYVKYLVLLGWTNAAIQTHMGWVDPAMVDIYALATLTY